MKKAGFKIVISACLITLITIACVMSITMSLASNIGNKIGIEEQIQLPDNEKLVDYTIDNGRLYYSTKPMGRNYEPKEYPVYSNGIHITTIIENKR